MGCRERGEGGGVTDVGGRGRARGQCVVDVMAFRVSHEETVISISSADPLTAPSEDQLVILQPLLELYPLSSP